MRGDYDPTNIKPIATKDLISWAYQVSIDLVSKLIEVNLILTAFQKAVLEFPPFM